MKLVLSYPRGRKKISFFAFISGFVGFGVVVLVFCLFSFLLGTPMIFCNLQLPVASNLTLGPIHPHGVVLLMLTTSFLLSEASFSQLQLCNCSSGHSLLDGHLKPSVL